MMSPRTTDKRFRVLQAKPLQDLKAFYYGPLNKDNSHNFLADWKGISILIIPMQVIDQKNFKFSFVFDSSNSSRWLLEL